MSTDFDFHIHSKYSFDSLLRPKQRLRIANRKKLDGIAITDHNTIRGGLEAKKYNADSDFLVIIGSEIRTEIGDIIGLFLNEDIESRNSLEVIDEIHAQGGVVVIPHPFRGHKIAELRNILGGTDLVEVFNARTNPVQNFKASEFAAAYKIPSIGGSDAHFGSEVGFCRTIIKGGNDIEEIRARLLKGNVEIIGEYGPAYLQPLSQIIKDMKTNNYRNIPFQIYNLINRIAGDVRNG